MPVHSCSRDCFGLTRVFAANGRHSGPWIDCMHLKMPAALVRAASCRPTGLGGWFWLLRPASLGWVRSRHFRARQGGNRACILLLHLDDGAAQHLRIANIEITHLVVSRLIRQRELLLFVVVHLVGFNPGEVTLPDPGQRDALVIAITAAAPGGRDGVPC